MSSERLKDLRGRLKNTNNAGPVVSSCSGEAGNPTTDNITSKYFPIVIDTMVENIAKSLNLTTLRAKRATLRDFEFWGKWGSKNLNFPPKMF